MATELGLMANESIVYKAEGVSHGGKMAPFTCELILTNFNLICVQKSTFGKVKDVLKYPVHQIKVFNGKPQALKSKKNNGYPCLDVYFINGSQESFAFMSNGNTLTEAFIKSISYVLGIGGVSAEDINDGGADNAFVSTVKDVGENFAKVGKDIMGAFGFKDKSGKTLSGTKSVVNKKCISCAAPLAGTEGTKVKCKYCDTVQSL